MLTAKKVAIRAWSPFGRWAHRSQSAYGREWWGGYGCPETKASIRAAYVDYGPILFSFSHLFLCEDNKPIDLVILYCVVMPYTLDCKRPRDSFHTQLRLLSPFSRSLDAGSMPTLFGARSRSPFLSLFNPDMD